MTEAERLADAADLDLSGAFIELAPPVGRLLVLVLVVIVLRRLTRRVIRRVDDARAREQLLFFMPKIVTVVALIGGLEVIGFDISGMAALLATIGFTGAVVFTPLGQNYVAGAMITIDDLYRRGEVVTAGEYTGRVIYQSVLRTELELPDGTMVWVPNSFFQEEKVLNHSRMGGFRISVEVPLDRAIERRSAVGIMEGVLAGLEWNCPGRRAFAAFERVGGEAMFYRAYAWIDDRTLEPYYQGLLLTDLVDALEDAGISVGQTTNLSLAAESGRLPVSDAERSEPTRFVSARTKK